MLNVPLQSSALASLSARLDGIDGAVSYLRRDLCAVDNLCPLFISGHAKDALSLAQMQEQTLQLEQQAKLKVCWNSKFVVQPAHLRQLAALWGV